MKPPLQVSFILRQLRQPNANLTCSKGDFEHYADLVSHEKAAINREFTNARDNGVSMVDALAMEDRAHQRLDALKAAVKEDPNLVLVKDHKTGHFVVAEGVCL